VLVAPNPDAYTELAKFQVLSAYCWNRTVISNGRLYARNSALSSEIVALDVATVLGVPTFDLAADLTPDGSQVRITLRPIGGGVFDSSHAAKIEVLAALDLTTSATTWTALPQTFTLSSGTLITEIPLGAENVRYLVAREKAN
jgi:hypothetical protein